MTPFLSTDNGPHDPADWAFATASWVFDLSATQLKGENLLKAQKLRLAIAESLMPHHSKVQTHEREKIATNVNRMDSPLSVQNHVDAAMGHIIDISKGTPWEAHFANPAVQDAAKSILRNHFATVQHIERLWHADRNPKCEISQRYKACFHKKG